MILFLKERKSDILSYIAKNITFIIIIVIVVFNLSY